MSSVDDAAGIRKGELTYQSLPHGSTRRGMRSEYCLTFDRAGCGVFTPPGKVAA